MILNSLENTRSFEKLSIANVTDIHLGHPKTPTTFIIDNLNQAFPNTPETGELDIIFISGDVFDRRLDVPNPDVNEIKLWINRLLRICKKYDILLRVLEGTPSHDWGQSKLFTQINDLVEIEADVKYIDKLDIEYIDKFGITVLYVPDEWNVECDDTWKDVNKLLKEKNLSKVDFSIMHGAMNYQLPPQIKAPTHIPERYLSITNYYVFIGHVHIHSVYERIIAGGSFDRLGHGDEVTKGHVRVTVRPNNKNDIVFISNKTAKVYKSIHCKLEELDKTFDYLDKEISKLPEWCFVRIVADKTHPILTNMDVLKIRYPTMRFDTKHEKDSDIVGEATINLKGDYIPIAINQRNIRSLLLDRIKDRVDDPFLLSKVEELLDECIS